MVNQSKAYRLPTAITVAGSDSGAGAGIQADLLTFAALGVYGTTAITCLTAQNPQSVSAIQAVCADFVHSQLTKLVDYFDVKALKTGMLYDAQIVHTVADFLQKNPLIKSVIDPVMVATSGAKLIQDDAITAYQKKLLPLATLITPNLDEAEVLLERAIKTEDTMHTAASDLAQQFQTCVLLKGGHLTGEDLIDILAKPDGQVEIFTTKRIHKIDTHGSGCTLSAAITAELAKGMDIPEAIHAAHHYLTQAMTQGLTIGSTRFINHFPNTP